MRILTAEAMHEVDRQAIEETGVPGMVLMENAAIGLADAVAENWPEADSAAVFCGPGNNGGDGLALARHLSVRGYHAEILLVSGGHEPAGDAGTQLGICRNLGLPIREVGPEDSLQGTVEEALGMDLIVDALFGIGLKRPLAGQFAELVEALNRLPLPLLAVDLPSGLNGSQSEIPGPHIEATLTVTFGAPKVAHVFQPAAAAVGAVVVADLGVPSELVEGAEGNLHLLVADELADLLPQRPAASHKGDYGHVLLVVGSTGKAGAAILAARSAVRSGAGLVTVAVPEEIVHTVDLGSVESMTFPLPQTETGGLGREALSALGELAEGKQVMALGPGLGRDPSTEEVIRSLVLETDLPVVIDADGVNAFAGASGSLKKRSAATVLTPHPGELARLLGRKTEEIQSDRLTVAEMTARETGACVLLKGHQSLLATPDGQVYINSTGNPGMATGGTGDVLTGLLAGFVSQGCDAVAAAQLAVFLHGLAGDLAAEKHGQAALVAGDLLDCLSEAMDDLVEQDA